MIEIEVRQSDGSVTGITVTGHAGLGRPGTDILCAAVSVLAENLGSGLKILLNLGDAAPEKKKKGYYRIDIPKSKVGEGTDLLFASALLGLRALAQQHPDRIEFI